MRSLVLLQREQICTSQQPIIAAAITEDNTALLCRHADDTLQICRGQEVIAEHPCPAANPRVFFRYLASRSEVSLVSSAGEICSLQLENRQQGLEVVGDIEGGVSAAVWSPEEERLALVTCASPAKGTFSMPVHDGKTADGQLLLLDSSYNIVSEKPLRPAGYGTDAPISVGWGDKTTQFHGSVGKAAARQVRQEQTTDWLDAAHDNLEPRISWRGDGAHLCVSTADIDNDGRLARVLRFYSREGEHLSTSEPTPGMEDTLGWQPSGSIIASVQRSQHPDGTIARDVIFFERNGLRRYDFGLSDCQDAIVTKLDWNCDSTYLAISLQGRDGACRVRLYTRSNYHWYLKYQTPRLWDFWDITWHAEEPLQLFIATNNSVTAYRFHQRTITAPGDRSLGLVAVIDGCELLLSTLGSALIPPPMCTKRIVAPAPLIDAAFAECGTALATIGAEGHVQLWHMPCSEVHSKPLTTTLDFATSFSAQRVVIRRLEKGWELAILGYSAGKSSIIRFSLDTATAHWTSEQIFLPKVIIALVYRRADLVLHASDGTCNILSPDGQLDPIAQLLEASSELACFEQAQSGPVFAGLSPQGKLCLSDRDPPQCAHCTSFAYCDGLLLYTTTASELHFVDFSSSATAFVPRKLERGSRLVTCVPEKMLAVLQMPRGNLESIYPRPVVYLSLRSKLVEKQYIDAFAICRKHRIDLNVLCDFDESAFVASIDAVLDGLRTADNINLLMTALRDVDTSQVLTGGCENSNSTSPGKANRILAVFLEALSRRGSSSSVSSVLTAQMRKIPPDYEGALGTVTALRTHGTEEAVEEAVSFMFFLVPDTERLFESALGMYDLKLALLIAQHAQKDPKEFLPFLRELQTLPLDRRKFNIDDHLKRHNKALTHLIRIGDAGAFEEACIYIVKHKLFDEAIALLSHKPTWLRTVAGLRGDWNMSKGRADNACSDFALAHNPARRYDALRASLSWQELFALLLSPRSPHIANKSTISTIAHEVAEDLALANRHNEAARVRLDYAQDVPGAIKALTRGAEWVEASRLAHLYGRGDLLGTTIASAALEVCDILIQTISDISSQIIKQTARLDELQRKREIERLGIPGIEEDGINDEFDVASEDSTAVHSQFTRYTATPSAGAMSNSTAKSGLSARSRRKHALKLLAGKRDTIHEDTYIFNSLVKVSEERLLALQSEVKPLLAFLLTLEADLGDSTYRARATALQTSLTTLEGQITKALDHAWGEDRDQAASSVRPARPTASGMAWRLEQLDLLTHTFTVS